MSLPLFELGMGNAKYSHVYGRVSVSYSRLLTERDIDSLISSDINVITSTLDSRGYGNQIRDLRTKEADSNLIESIMISHFRDMLDEVSSMIPGKNSSEFKTTFTSIWDAKNLATIYAGITSELPIDQIRKSITPLGLITPEVLEDILLETDLDGLSKKIPQFAPILTNAHASYIAEEDLTLTRTIIEKEILIKLMNSLSRVYKEYLKLRIEALDIALVLRCKSSQIDPIKYWSNITSILSEKQAKELVSSDLIQGLKILSETEYKDLFHDYVKNSDNPLYINKKMDGFIDQQVSNRAMNNPLSAYYILQYIKKKYDEVMKVRAILIGKKLGLKPDVIRGLVK